MHSKIIRLTFVRFFRRSECAHTQTDLNLSCSHIPTCYQPKFSIWLSDATCGYIAEYDGITLLYTLLKKLSDKRDLKLVVLDLFGYLSSHGK